MNYIATLSKGDDFSPCTAPFDDRPFVGDKVLYRGSWMTVVAVHTVKCGCWNFTKLGHCIHTV